MYGGPEDWFGIEGVEDGENWQEITDAYYRLLVENNSITKSG